MTTATPATPAPVVKLADLGPKGAFALTEAEIHDIEHALGHYPDGRAASLDALKAVQKARGWIPDEALEPVARLIGISPAELDGVATFYNRLYRQPVGRHVILVCDSIACFLTGYDEVRDALMKSLRVGYGETTPDNRFTLLPICCLGNCDKGPTLMIDDDTHSFVAPEAVPALLEAYA